MHTPSRPLNFAYPTASNAAISSCRACMNGPVVRSPQAAEQPVDAITGIAEDVLHSPLPEPSEQVVTATFCGARSLPLRTHPPVYPNRLRICK